MAARGPKVGEERSEGVGGPSGDLDMKEAVARGPDYADDFPLNGGLL